MRTIRYRRVSAAIASVFALALGSQMASAAAPPGDGSGLPPTVSIDSPANDHATNTDILLVEVSFAPATNPQGQYIGNVEDVDLLLNGEIYQTIPHIPPIHAPSTEVFEVDISGFENALIEFVAHA